VTATLILRNESEEEGNLHQVRSTVDGQAFETPEHFRVFRDYTSNPARIERTERTSKDSARLEADHGSGSQALRHIARWETALTPIYDAYRQAIRGADRRAAGVHHAA